VSAQVEGQDRKVANAPSAAKLIVLEAPSSRERDNESDICPEQSRGGGETSTYDET